MKPHNRIDIIIGKLKPGGKEHTATQAANPMMSSDFPQEVEGDSRVELETYAEDFIKAIKLDDATQVAEAFKCMFDAMKNQDESPEEMMSDDD